MQHSLAQSRQRASSLSKSRGMASLGTLTTGPMQPSGVNSPSAPTTGSLASPSVKVERGTVGQLSVVPPNQLNEDGVDTMKALVSAIQRYLTPSLLNLGPLLLKFLGTFSYDSTNRVLGVKNVI